MNAQMLKTELYKLFCRKIVWIACLGFLALIALIYSQFDRMDGVRNDLEPVRAKLTAAVAKQELLSLVRKQSYHASFEEIAPFIPPEAMDYIEVAGLREDEDGPWNFLHHTLAYTINNYVERIDNRAARIAELREEVSASGHDALSRAKARILEDYERSDVVIELNLDAGTNDIIDMNAAFLARGLMMIVILVGLAGIFADEHASRTTSALLTSKNGRISLFLTKLTAAGIYVFTIVTVMEAAYLTISALFQHVDNISVTAASTYGLSLTTYGGKVWQLLIRQFLGTLLGAVTVGSITLCLSSVAKSSLMPFFGAGAYYGVTTLWHRLFGLSAYLTDWMSLPAVLSADVLSAQTPLMEAGHYTSVLGLLVPSLTLNVIFHIVLSLICLGIACHAYTKKQVKG